jgi:CO/xanthine dehydrogenase FAD-binding subunit
VDGPGGRREIAAADFFVTHFLTTLDAGELVVETVWPRPIEG